MKTRVSALLFERWKLGIIISCVVSVSCTYICIVLRLNLCHTQSGPAFKKNLPLVRCQKTKHKRKGKMVKEKEYACMRSTFLFLYVALSSGAFNWSLHRASVRFRSLLLFCLSNRVAPPFAAPPVFSMAIGNCAVCATLQRRLCRMHFVVVVVVVDRFVKSRNHYLHKFTITIEPNAVLACGSLGHWKSSPMK